MFPIKNVKKTILRLFVVVVVLFIVLIIRLVSNDTLRVASKNSLEKSKTDNYIITNVLEVGDNKTIYLDVVTSLGSYTERLINSSVTPNGEGSYELVNWFTKDGKLYTNNKDSWLLMPEYFSIKNKYKDVISSKHFTFSSTSLFNYAKISIYKPSSEIQLDLGYPTLSNVKLYTTSSDIFKEFNINSMSDYYFADSLKAFALDSSSLDLLKDFKTKSKDGDYIEKKSEITIGVYNNEIVYLYLTTKTNTGEVVKLTRTKVTQVIEERSLPDFTNAIDYMKYISNLSKSESINNLSLIR